MSAPQTNWHQWMGDADLSELARGLALELPAWTDEPGRVEWMRPTPAPETPPEPEPADAAMRAAERMIAAGEAGVLWLVGVAVGGALVVAAETIARSLS